VGDARAVLYTGGDGRNFPASVRLMEVCNEKKCSSFI